MDHQNPVLFVSWRSPQTRLIRPVGRLLFCEESGLFEFVYIAKARDAAREGFLPFLDFPSVEKIYRSQKLFPLFANRVLAHNRPEFQGYISALGLTPKTAHPMHILARTGGRRETDQLEMFPLPLPDPETGAYVTHCLVRGIQYMQPNIEERITRLKPDELLFLMWDIQNPVDPTAMAVRTEDNALLGYLPAYITQEIQQLAAGCSSIHVTVEQVNPAPAGVHHRLLCKIEGCWPPSFTPFNTPEYLPIPAGATQLEGWLQTRLDHASVIPPTTNQANVPV